MQKYMINVTHNKFLFLHNTYKYDKSKVYVFTLIVYPSINKIKTCEIYVCFYCLCVIEISKIETFDIFKRILLAIQKMVRNSF